MVDKKSSGHRKNVGWWKSRKNVSRQNSWRVVDTKKISDECRHVFIIITSIGENLGSFSKQKYRKVVESRKNQDVGRRLAKKTSVGKNIVKLSSRKKI